uniref:Uncharacterized protein n=1 Tax=virus sp. ctx9V1 TaxID=2828001 RepID=A0A8S5RDK4_9VIRU|nr:MAG TPA: hypothetical protein [virus sp. ctx9V1]
MIYLEIIGMILILYHSTIMNEKAERILLTLEYMTHS